MKNLKHIERKYDISTVFQEWEDKMKSTQPNLVKIMSECQKKMEIAYLKYGNSWLDYQGLQFWKKRLDGEIKEIWEAKTFEEYQKEIIDAINILSMMHDKHDDFLFSKPLQLPTKNAMKESSQS